jgi:hypothetical protein
MVRSFPFGELADDSDPAVVEPDETRVDAALPV